MNSDAPVAGVILAGGLARRMAGADKPLVQVGGRPMLAHVIDRLRPQVSAMALNANGDASRFAAFGLPVVADPIEGFAGPLAGVLAGMRWAEESVPAASFIVSVAADTPFFSLNLVAKFSAARAGAADKISIAASADGTHPVFGLWPIRLADDLETFLHSGEGGKILRFVDRHSRIDVHFDEMAVQDGTTVDPFFNVNTPDDAARAKTIAAALPAEDRR